MTVPLSPAAQAVLDAYGHCQGTYEAQVATACSGTAWLAAALRAAADQVVPEETPLPTTNGHEARKLFNTPEEWGDALIEQEQRHKIRTAFLAIANELNPTP